MIICFIWQSWGDHTDVVQAAFVYLLGMLIIFVYCHFGEKLSSQVIIIWLLYTDYSDSLPYGLLLIEYTGKRIVFLGITVIINTQKLMYILNFTFHSPKISCINTSVKLAKIVSWNSKLLHKISHTFTVIFLKYTALNTGKYVSVSTALKLLIST